MTSISLCRDLFNGAALPRPLGVQWLGKEISILESFPKAISLPKCAFPKASLPPPPLILSVHSTHHHVAGGEMQMSALGLLPAPSPAGSMQSPTKT